MYLWNIKKLENEISSGAVNQRDQFLYTILHAFIIGLASVAMFTSPEVETPADFLFGALQFLIPISGTFLAYRFNGSGDGKDFILRYFCLMVPIMIRVGALLVVGLVVLGFMTPDGPATQETVALEHAMVTLTFIIEYTYLAIVMKRLAGNVGTEGDTVPNIPRAMHSPEGLTEQKPAKRSMWPIAMAIVIVGIVFLMVFSSLEVERTETKLLSDAESFLILKQYSKAFNKAQKLVDGNEYNKKRIAKALLIQAIAYYAEGSKALAKDRIKRALHFSPDVNHRSSVDGFNAFFDGLKTQ